MTAPKNQYEHPMPEPLDVWQDAAGVPHKVESVTKAWVYGRTKGRDFQVSIADFVADFHPLEIEV